MKIGIDFGTTFSLPSCVVNAAAVSLLPSGEYGVPSLFYYDEEVGVQIGKSADDNGIYYPENLVREVKMDIQSHKSGYTIAGRTFSRQDVVGGILKEVARLAKEECARRQFTSQELDGVVISVPAAFNLREIEFIRRAAVDTAGLNVLGFIREPVAAAIAYFNAPNGEDQKNILVYDLGGGTCDIAIVRSDRNSPEWYHVINSDMDRIGGRDWDKEMVELIKRKLSQKFGMTRFDGMTQEDIYRQAVSAKQMLSRNENARIQLMVDRHLLSCVVTRREFEQATRHLLDRTMQLTRRLLDNTRCNLDYIVCVGGSSNMPQIRAALEERFPQTPVRIYEPEKAIAFGAAIYAQNVEKPKFLRDICKFSYGVCYVEDYGTYHDENRLRVINFIYKGEALPAAAENISRLFRPGYKSVQFVLYESECMDRVYMPEQGTNIGKVVISGLVNSAAGDAFKTTLEIDRSGLLHAKSVDMKTGKSATTTIQLENF